jgi:hypothetical protein
MHGGARLSAAARALRTSSRTGNRDRLLPARQHPLQRDHQVDAQVRTAAARRRPQITSRYFDSATVSTDRRVGRRLAVSSRFGAGRRSSLGQDLLMAIFVASSRLGAGIRIPRIPSF